MERIATQMSTRRQLVQARVRRARLDSSEQIVGRSPVMCRMMDRLNATASSDAPVVLLGERGTGKELVARALHDRGGRRGGPFVALNCASFPDTSPDSELHGHQRAVLSEADAHRPGHLQAAHGGTLLLDRVDDMSTAAQVKLLRLLDEHNIAPLDESGPTSFDVRVISAARHDLWQMTRAGQFREDLYRRLNVLGIEVPQLRARDGDLPLLTQYFLNKFHRRGSAPAQMSPTAWSALSAFAFPGNVRQLGRALEHAMVMAVDGEIEPRHLPSEITSGIDPVPVPSM